LVDIAHEHLLSMLVSMQITPGERIRIDAVARQLGISQTPIREALRRLEAENLVHKITNVGYRASSQMSRREIDDLYELRMLIEPYAAGQAAAGAMTDDDVRLLSEMEKDMDKVKAGTGVAYARFAEADATLHRLIAAGSGNRLIAETIERLHVHLHIFQILFSTKTPGQDGALVGRGDAPEEAGEEHSRIIRALLDRDSAAAEAAMRHHLERSRARIDEALKRSVDEAAGKALKKD